MKRREFIAAGAGAAVVAMMAGMVSGCSTTGAAGECRKGCAKVNNKDFYIGGSFDANGISSGKFDVAKGKQAYFDLMRKFGYPVFRSFTDEAFMLRETKQTDKTQYLGFWATDFAKGDFAKFGMGGVIWVDEIKEEYFGHDIFLLPLQSIAEHSHVPGKPVAANVSQDRAFNAMLGFTEEETLAVYRDFKGVGAYQEGEPEAIVRSIKPWYDGYCFSRDKIGRESVFNSDMVLYHLKSLVAKGRPPENMVDVNISTDYDKLETIVDLQRAAGAQDAEDVSPLTEELAATGEIAFDLVASFPADEIIKPENFRSLFHYYGVLSMAERREGLTYFRIPNACVEQQLFNYLRDSYRRAKLPDWIGWSKLASAMAYRGEWEPFLRRLAEDFANTTPIRGDISGEIRLQGYMQAEFGHIRYYLAKPEMELSRGYCDFCLFPERVYNGDVRDSYIIELKHSKGDASDAEIAAKAEDGIAQLKRYAADPTVPALSAGTRLHCILYQFKGAELIRLEEIAL